MVRLRRHRSCKAVFPRAKPVKRSVRFVLSDMRRGWQGPERMDCSTLEPLPTETIDPWLQADYQNIGRRL